MSNNILQEYDTSFSLFKTFEIKMKHLVEDLLETKNIKVHNISSRIKARESLERKITSKNKYNNFSQITDILGLRIITFFEDEVDIIAKLISEEFEIDTENSIDKRIIEYDKFGYSSLHYVVSVNSKRTKLLEYKSYKTFKFEIQIRSILQHAWAEIEHDIGYKTKTNIPEVVKRNFSRVAALLETSDLEFTKLKLKLNEYEQEVEQEIVENPVNVDINDISLKSFISSSKLIQELDSKISVFGKLPLNKTAFKTSEIPKLKYLNIENISELSKILEQKKNEILKFAELFNEVEEEQTDGAYFSMGISIYYLCLLLIVEKNNSEDLLAFINRFWPSNYKSLINRTKESYNRMSQQ